MRYEMNTMPLNVPASSLEPTLPLPTGFLWSQPFQGDVSYHKRDCSSQPLAIQAQAHSTALHSSVRSRACQIRMALHALTHTHLSVMFPQGLVYKVWPELQTLKQMLALL